MNARKLIVSVLMLVSVLLAACASATATPPAPTIIPSTVPPTLAPTQAPNPQVVEYNLPTSASEPGGIVAGPDGALWFVETAVNKIGRISTDGIVTEYPVPTARAIDTDQGFLAVGPDGALWFNEDLANQIGRITTSGQVTEYKLPDEFKPTQEQDFPIRTIVAGPDGALWVTSSAVNAIVKLTMDGKVAAKYVLPEAGSLPVGMVVGPDGALWFVEKGANQIGRITLDGKLSEYALPDFSSGALRMIVGPDMVMWFTMHDANKIGRISTDGKITTFDAAGMGPVGITSGADGALWFTGYGSTEIGRMTTDGQLTKIQVPTTASVPYHITAGPDGNLWFTEQQGNKIGQIQLSASATIPSTIAPVQALTTFSPKTFKLITSISFGSDWHVEEDLLHDLYLDNGKMPIVFNIVTTAQLVDPVGGNLIPFPDDFMSWIQSDPDFKTGEPTQVTVGGISGGQIDATPNTKINKKTFGLTWNILTSDGDWRFILLDNVKGERVLIFMIAPTGKTFSAVPELQQEIQSILDSVVFTQ